MSRTIAFLHTRPVGTFHHFGERFHFLATPHYREGVALLTRRDKGRVVLTLRHPVDVAEAVCRRPGGVDSATEGLAQTREDVEDTLLRCVHAPDFVDNRMTWMLVGMPPGAEVTKAHFRGARSTLTQEREG